MVSNIKFYYKQCLKPNEKFYLEIKNKSPEYLNATMFYTLFGKDVIKPSPPFGPGKSQRIVFPSDALCIFFQVFRTAFKPPALVCTKQIANNKISHFKVEVDQTGKFTCVKI